MSRTFGANLRTCSSMEYDTESNQSSAVIGARINSWTTYASQSNEDRGKKKRDKEERERERKKMNAGSSESEDENIDMNCNSMSISAVPSSAIDLPIKTQHHSAFTTSSCPKPICIKRYLHRTGLCRMSIQSGYQKNKRVVMIISLALGYAPIALPPSPKMVGICVTFFFTVCPSPPP